MQEVPEGRKESSGGPWQFIGLLPLFDPPRHDSAETIRRALNLGVNVKMITGTSGFFIFMFNVLKHCLQMDCMLNLIVMATQPLNKRKRERKNVSSE